MKSIILSSLVCSILFAKQYTVTSNAVDTSKNSACKKALVNAKEDAMGQAGTLVISSFENSTTIDKDIYNRVKNKDLKTISIGIAKVISKNEDVKLLDNYMFDCKVKAIIEVDEDDMKKAISQYIEKKKVNKKEVIFTVVGYSADGQSKYSAMRSAEIDAKRKLLEAIKGSEIFSILETENGKLTSDKVASNIQGKLSYYKISSRIYDKNSQSAEVTMTLTKDGLEKNINR